MFTCGEDYLEVPDEQEDRRIAIGATPLRVVLVVLTERDEDVIRIISARWATRTERRRYLEYHDQRS